MSCNRLIELNRALPAIITRLVPNNVGPIADFG